MKLGLHDHTYGGVKTDMGTTHPGPDLHQIAVEDQPETVRSANEGTNTSFGSPRRGGGSVESARPLSTLSTRTLRYGAPILEINPPGPTPPHRLQNFSLPCESTPELLSL